MLELVDIKKDYHFSNVTVNALKGVNLEFRQHEFVSILGPSGCGKTTLLNIIGGLDLYSSGNMLIYGRTTKDYSPQDWDAYRNRRIGFIFQNYNLIKHLNVLNNVELALTISGIKKKQRRAIAINALEQVGLSEHLMKRPSELSGGQKQRVAIARAIVNNPEIILADEPTGALDSMTSLQVMEILKTISKDRLVVMVTHNIDLANQYSDRIINLCDGNIISDTKPYTEWDKKAEGYYHEDEIEKLAENVISKENKNVLIAQNSDNENDDDETNTDKSSVNHDKKKSKKNFWCCFKKKKSLYIKPTHLTFSAIFGLSGKNMLRKKWRTFLTIFATSIGIVGISLILAISNGFSEYMKMMETNTLSTYPLEISSTSLDFSLNLSKNPYTKPPEGSFPSDDAVFPSDSIKNDAFMTYHANYITEQFVEYVKDMDASHPDWSASVYYERNLKMHLMTKNSDANLPTYKTMSASSSHYGWWQELLNEQYVQQKYDLLAGKYPKSKQEMVLIVDQNNQLAKSTLELLGYKITASNGSYNPIDFKDFIGKYNENGDKISNGKIFKMISNDDFFVPTGQTVVDSDTKENIQLFTEVSPNDYESVYNLPNNLDLEIVGVLRLKQGEQLNLFSSGLGFMSGLTDEALKTSKNSRIVQEQLKTNIDVLSNGSTIFNYDFSQIDKYAGILGVSENEIITHFYVDKKILTIEQKEALEKNFSFESLYNFIISDGIHTIDDMLAPLLVKYDINFLKQLLNSNRTYRLKNIGAISTPSSIFIYPNSFKFKTEIKNHLDKFNVGKEEAQKIKYTDMAATVARNVENVINIASYILLAFAIIALIVSCVMISIITYISVLERTKEIGILRSLGARRVDIGRVFNAETFMLGLASGIIGVSGGALLTLPVNMILNKYIGFTINNIATLKPVHGVLLVVLSIALTILSGLLPAIIASRKKPVQALKS